MNYLFRALELKVRHVRTAAGVRRYNLPIGSPIVGAGKPKTKIPKGKLKVTKSPNNPDIRDIQRRTIQLAEGFKAPRKKKNENVSGLLWEGVKYDGLQDGLIRSSLKTDEFPNGPTGILRYYNADPQSGTYIYIYEDPTAEPMKRWTGWSSVLTGDDAGVVTDFGPEPKSVMSRMAREMAPKRVAINKHDEVVKARRTRSEEGREANYFNTNNGVYGWDWNWGDEDPTLMHRAKSPDRGVSAPARRELAAQESEAIGINVVTGEGPTAIDVASHELVNSVMRYYAEEFPGINNVIPLVFVMDPEIRKQLGPGIVAFNRHVYGSLNVQGSPYQATWGENVSGDKELRTWDHDEIGLAFEAFGHKFEESILQRKARGSYGSNWWSNNLIKIARDQGIEPWQVYQIHTLNHEIGHTFARAVFGDFANDGKWSMSTSKGYAAVSPELKSILERYQVVSGIKLEDAVERKEYVFDEYSLSNMVSTYGASSSHELLAESWAAYVMGEKVTPLVKELGELMEREMKKMLEKEQEDN